MVEDWQKELKVLFTDLLDDNGEDMTTTKIQANSAQFSRYIELDLLHPPSGVHDNKIVIQAAKMNR
jgi:hypothetical protein